jgi:hypothetical protein
MFAFHAGAVEVPAEAVELLLKEFRAVARDLGDRIVAAATEGARFIPERGDAATLYKAAELAVSRLREGDPRRERLMDLRNAADAEIRRAANED